MAGRSISDIVEVFLLPAVYYSLKEHVLYCIVLYCIVLYCIVLYCIVLYCIQTKYNISQHSMCHGNKLPRNFKTQRVGS